LPHDRRAVRPDRRAKVEAVEFVLDSGYAFTPYPLPARASLGACAAKAAEQTLGRLDWTVSSRDDDARPPLDPALPRALGAQSLWLLGALCNALQRTEAGRDPGLLAQITDEELHEGLLLLILRGAVTLCAEARGLVPRGGRLFCASGWRLLEATSRRHNSAIIVELQEQINAALSWVELSGSRFPVPYAKLPVEQVGGLYEGLIGTRISRAGARRRIRLQAAPRRKLSGSYYTPRELTEPVVRHALLRHFATAAALDPTAQLAKLASLRICDPAMGSGAFLLEACRQLARELDAAQRRAGRRPNSAATRRQVVRRCLYGVDVNRLAVAVAEASLWLAVGDPQLQLGEVTSHLRCGDSVVGLDPEGLARLRVETAAQHAKPAAEQQGITLALFAAEDELPRWTCQQPQVAQQAADLIVGSSLLAGRHGPAAAGIRRSLDEARQQACRLAAQRCPAPLPESDQRLAAARRACALHWPLEFPEVFGDRGGFDVVLGNPPWVAFAGRAAKPLASELRAHYARAFAAWRGYPTLHALFVERSVRIAPAGTIALLVPSPLADLDGYRAARAAVTVRHILRQPLLEFGQDAFAAVTQPCFALVADPSPRARRSDASWTLAERQRATGAAEQLRVPEVLQLLARAPALPPALFREMGFQSTGLVTRQLFLRAPKPDAEHGYPLLEGRNVREFHQDPPGLFLRVDRDLLRRAGVRLRAQDEYQRVSFVVRQTAAVPIAALHGGLPFRNSLLAGFAVENVNAELAVGLLNSALYRALHLASRRDARQAAFPQVKIRHLRALPRPPDCARLRRRVELISREATSGPFSQQLRAELDESVFELFAIPRDHRRRVVDFLAQRVPQLQYRAADSGDCHRCTSLAAVGERLRM
jgi:hypothetical protein